MAHEEQAKTPLDVEQVLAQVHHPRGETRSELDRPLGIGPDCLSARGILELLEEGMGTESYDHLVQCRPCLRNVRNAATVLRDEPDFVAVAQRIADAGTTRKWWRPSSRSSCPLQGILALEDPVRMIPDPSGRGVSKVWIIPAFSPERLAALDVNSVSVGGAIQGKAVSVKPVDLDESGVPDVLEIQVEWGRLAQAVQAGLDNDQRVVDAITVSGRFDDGRELVCRAKVTFEPRGVAIASAPSRVAVRDRAGA